MTWVHRVLYNLPPDCTCLAQSITGTSLSVPAAEGINNRAHVGYGGPCPPTGRRRYINKLHALNVRPRT
jgi:phosphatidylethanolamine-binding protein (PEBP) family uncharacterized protein